MKETIEARIQEILHLQSSFDGLDLGDATAAALLAYTRGRLTSLRAELENANG